jgi:hypothetical protein
MEPSIPAEASQRPFELNATDKTPELWPRSAASSAPVCDHQTRTTLSSPAEAITVPSGCMPHM